MRASQQRGQLYLGREYDLSAGTVTDRPVLYDVHHLTTHAVIPGMTGSGKTGLGVVFLEEALLQGVPALIRLLQQPPFQQVPITPRRADVTVEFCGLAWVPAWQVALPARDLGGQDG